MPDLTVGGAVPNAAAKADIRLQLGAVKHHGAVANEAAMVALANVNVGDTCSRSGAVWRCNSLPSSTAGNWTAQADAAGAANAAQAAAVQRANHTGTQAASTVLAEPFGAPVTGTTHTATPGELRSFTNATNCNVTLPNGAASGATFVARTGHATGTVTFLAAGAKNPSGTTRIGGAIGKIMVAICSGSDEWDISGYDPDGSRFLGEFADWPALMTAYPLGGAAIAALGSMDYGIVLAPNNVAGPVEVVPNRAKNRMVFKTRRLCLGQLGGSFANPIAAKVDTGVTAATRFDFTAFQLPANMARPGDKFVVRMSARREGTAGSIEIQCKLGTTNGTGDQTIAKVSITATTNQDGAVDQEVYVRTTTELAALQSTILNSSSTNVQNTPTTDVTVLQYLSMACGAKNTADTITPTMFSVELVQAA